MTSQLRRQQLEPAAAGRGLQHLTGRCLSLELVLASTGAPPIGSVGKTSAHAVVCVCLAISSVEWCHGYFAHRRPSAQYLSFNASPELEQSPSIMRLPMMQQCVDVPLLLQQLLDPDVRQDDVEHDNAHQCCDAIHLPTEDSAVSRCRCPERRCCTCRMSYPACMHAHQAALQPMSLLPRKTTTVPEFHTQVKHQRFETCVGAPPRTPSLSV